MTCAQRGALPSPVVGWIFNYAAQNHWRVSGFYDIDDLCQDGLLIAVICRNRYGIPGIDITRKYEVRGDTLYLADQKVSDVALPALGELARYMEEWPEYLKRAVRHL